MTTYIVRPDGIYDKATGERTQIVNDWQSRPLCAPSVRSDLSPYRSPIDGREIGSRSVQREDLKRNGCVLAEPRKKPRGYRSEAFAQKHGLKMAEPTN